MRRRLGALPEMLAAATLTAGALGLGACVEDPRTVPTSTTLPVLPSTTLVTVELGPDRREDSQQVDVYAGETLDGRPVLLHSDDPATPFVDGEPAEVRRIADAAVAGDCDQLFTLLEFWATAAEPVHGDDESDADGEDPLDESALRASVYARAAYDAIVFIGCGDADSSTG